MHGGLRRGLEILGACAFIIATPASVDSMRWWRSPRVVAALHLSAAQARAINTLYEQSLPVRRKKRTAAYAAHARLDRLIKANAPEDLLEGAAVAAIDHDADASRERMFMLVRMYRVLTPAQRDALRRLADQQHARSNDPNRVERLAHLEAIGW